MGTILNLLKKVEAIDTDRICIDAITEVIDVIPVKNRERMNEGIRADGTVMPNYSYISQKVYGYPNEPIKLKATGAFQGAIKTIISGSTITTDSTDYKSEMLQNRYGKEIFGLDKTTKQEFVSESLRPAFKNKMESSIGLKFN